MLDSLGRVIRIYVVPGAVFQSVVVAGGYGTGREVVEYLTRFGPRGGLQAIAVAAIVFSIVFALSYEFARRFSVYDYRRFFKTLLGRAWISYEMIFVITIIPVMAVMTAASGEVLENSFGVPPFVGIGIMFALIVTLNYCGTEVVTKSLTVGALIVIVTLLAFCMSTINLHFDAISDRFQSAEATTGWALSGSKFAVYNMVSVPALLYAVTAIETRRQAMLAGLVAGLMAVVPALLFHVAFMSHYPEVVSQNLPTYWVLQELGMSGLTAIYVVVLFLTIVQTGVGILRGLSTRLDASAMEIRGKRLNGATHAAIAAALIIAASLLSSVGIVTLVARGYSFIAWALLFVFVLPLLTIGLLKILKAPPPRLETRSEVL